MADLAMDADGDALTFFIVSDPGDDPDVLFWSLVLDPVTGGWQGDCFGFNAESSFQWYASDGQANSNIATQTLKCFE